MTRTEAINLIGWLKSKTNRDDDLEAIDMAIEALTQPIVCKDSCIDDDHIYCSPKVAARVVEALSRTGEWIWSDEDMSWKCGNCGCVFEEIDWKPEYNFCPNCGARMKGGDD